MVSLLMLLNSKISKKTIAIIIASIAAMFIGISAFGIFLFKMKINQMDEAFNMTCTEMQSEYELKVDKLLSSQQEVVPVSKSDASDIIDELGCIQTEKDAYILEGSGVKQVFGAMISNDGTNSIVYIVTDGDYMYNFTIGRNGASNEVKAITKDNGVAITKDEYIAMCQ